VIVPSTIIVKVKVPFLLIHYYNGEFLFIGGNSLDKYNEVKTPKGMLSCTQICTIEVDLKKHPICDQPHLG